MVAIDNRRSFRFYNASILLWVTGNFIWMVSEMVECAPSSNVHLGPHVPIGGLSKEALEGLLIFKEMLFITGTLIQVVLYVGIYNRCLAMPEEEGEDQVSRNEVNILLGRVNNASKPYTKQADFDSLFDLADDFSLTSVDSGLGSGVGTAQQQRATGTLSLAFIENGYIIFWISKDLFWSWSTGDLTQVRDLAIFFETAAMLCGTVSILIYTITAYIYRRSFVRFLDSVTLILWIMANFVWMCGEFFIRYDNMERDDGDPGNDGATRIVSAVLFCSGISLQFYVILKLVVAHRKQQLAGDGRQKGKRYIEMFNMFRPGGGGAGGRQNGNSTSGQSSVNGNNDSTSSGGGGRYSNVSLMMTAFSPQHSSGGGGGFSIVDEDDEEEMVLF